MLAVFNESDVSTAAANSGTELFLGEIQLHPSGLESGTRVLALAGSLSEVGYDGCQGVRIMTELPKMSTAQFGTVPTAGYGCTISEMESIAAARDAIVRRLVGLIEASKSSVVAVEDALGKSRGYVSDAVLGRKRITAELLLEVLAVLNLPADTMFVFDEPRKTGTRLGLESLIAEPPSAYLLADIRNEHPDAPDELIEKDAKLQEIAKWLMAEMTALESERRRYERAELRQKIAGRGGGRRVWQEKKRGAWGAPRRKG